MNNPNVQRLIHTKAALDLRVSKSFFEGGGWVAPEEYYFGTFDPKTDWVARRRNELKISFDGDARKTKTTLQLRQRHIIHVDYVTHCTLTVNCALASRLRIMRS